ncbi:ATP-binding protein, partial [[Clostridium] polysaccharolyticum]
KSMIKAGAFPHHKELKDFDFTFQSCINQQQIAEFGTLRFLEQNENIVFLGTSGVGKTHLATSIGIEAAQKRISTYFIKCNDLLQQLKKAKAENRLQDRLKHFCHYRLLIIDELVGSSDGALFTIPSPATSNRA